MMDRLIRGFTLIELLVTLSVGVLLFLLTSQNFTYLQRSNTRTALTDTIASAVQYANLVAMTEVQGVYLKPILKGDNWASEVGLFSVSGNQLLYTWDWKYKGWQIQWRGFESKEYLKLGTGPEHAASNGHFIITNLTTHEQSKLILNRLGRVVKSEENIV